MDHLKHVDNEHFFKYINNDLDLCTLDNDPDFSKKPDSDDNKCIKVKVMTVNMRTILKNGYDYKNGYIRFSLNDNTILPLEELSHIKIQCFTDSCNLYNINILLNIILMDKYGYKMTIIDTKEFLEHNTESSTNSKYQFKNKNRYYLDIPLLEEFYKYDQDMSHNSTNHIYYDIYSAKNCKSIKFVETSIKFEQITKHQSIIEPILDNIQNKLLALTTKVLTFTMKPNFLSNNSRTCTMVSNFQPCKFIFMIIEKTSHDTPQVEEIILNKLKNPVIISLNNIIQYELDTLLIYGISTDPKCDMHCFSHIPNESINDNNTYFSYTCVSDFYVKFNQDINSKEFYQFRLLCVDQMTIRHMDYYNN
jgi:hypothetical protein